MNLLKKLLAANPTAAKAAEAQPQQPPRLLTDTDIAAVAGGPQVENNEG